MIVVDIAWEVAGIDGRTSHSHQPTTFKLRVGSNLGTGMEGSTIDWSLPMKGTKVVMQYKMQSVRRRHRGKHKATRGEDGGLTMSTHQFAHAGKLLSLHHLLVLVIFPSSRKISAASNKGRKKVARLICLCMVPYLRMCCKHGGDMRKTPSGHGHGEPQPVEFSSWGNLEYGCRVEEEIPKFDWSLNYRKETLTEIEATISEM